MNAIQRCLERLVPQSTFGVTTVTIASIILIAAFFIKGIDHVNDGTKKVALVAPASQPKSCGLPDKLSGEPEVDPPPKVKPPTKVVPPPVSVKPSPRLADNRSSLAPGCVATLTRTSACRWAENADAPTEGAQLRKGQTLNVASGLAEIAFACGAKAILQGPAVLEIQSEKTGHLKVGRMTADVPDDLEGFKIRTPTAEITSLPSKAAKTNPDDKKPQA